MSETGQLRVGERAETTHVVSPSSIDDRLVRDEKIVTGYNHNVPHRSRIYHIQTEDSGRAKGHIFTHLFYSGTIIASQRTYYDAAAAAPVIIDLARKSHKSMMRRLVHGSLDEKILQYLGEATLADHEADPPPSPTKRTRAPFLELVAPLDPTEGQEDLPLANLRRLIETLNMDNINQTLENLRTNVAGTLGVALVDYESGMCLGTAGNGLNMDLAAAGNMEVMKAKSRVMHDLGIEGGIDDILITLKAQYHIIRPIGTSLFLYIAIDRKQGNLALARHKLNAAADEIKL